MRADRPVAGLPPAASTKRGSAALGKAVRFLASWPMLLIVVASRIGASYLELDYHPVLAFFALLEGGALSLELGVYIPLIAFAAAILGTTIVDTFEGDRPNLGPWLSGRHFVCYVTLFFVFDHPVSNWVFALLAFVSLALVLALADWRDPIDPRVFRPDVLASGDNVAKVRARLVERPHGVYCGDVRDKAGHHPLYVDAQDRGIVIGPPGTGKTAFMVTQLLEWAERKGSFVCLDIKPELHAILHAELVAQGYRVLVFNPSNPIDRYNLFDDLSGITAIGELAASLVPSSGADGRAFDEGARDILDGIVSYLRAEARGVSLPAIRQFLAGFASEKELIRTLSASTDPDVQEIAFALSRAGANARFMGSVFATLRANLRFLRYDDIRRAIETSDFSLTAFLDAQPVALFLQFEERYQETTSLLLAATVSHLFNFFVEHTNRDPVLLMLDEIGNVPRIPGLVEKLNTIRSRKLPTWLYWQGLQQMQKYGLQAGEGPNAIMAACDFHAAFRLNDNDTARWFSERIGTVDRQSISMDSTLRSSYQSLEEPILKVADLQALPVGESIAIYRGHVWRNRATPYFERWPAMARA